MTSPWLLCADIGGTNLRLRAFDGHRDRASEQHETGGPGDLAEIFGTFAAAQGTPPELVVAAVAGPVSDNRVNLTNASKSLCGEDLKRTTGAAEAWLINDFAAAAWATARTAPDDLLCLQGAPAPRTEGIHVVVGPGSLGDGLARVEPRGGARGVVDEEDVSRRLVHPLLPSRRQQRRRHLACVGQRLDQRRQQARLGEARAQERAVAALLLRLRRRDHVAQLLRANREHRRIGGRVRVRLDGPARCP